MMEYAVGSSGWILDHCTSGNINVLNAQINSNTAMIVLLGCAFIVYAIIALICATDCIKYKKFLREQKMYARFVEWKENKE